MEIIGLLLSMLLTLMVLSYMVGDNPVFKLAEHIFVGVSIGYALVAAWYLVIAPALLTVGAGSFGVNVISKLPPLLLCFLLLFKVQPNSSKITGTLGSIALAFLVGVGAAVAIAGAVQGTLYPQTAATMSINLNPANPLYADSPIPYIHNEFLSNIVVLLGTVGTLFYFTFTSRPQGFLGQFREGFVNFWAGMGRWVILITLGALFANTVSSRIALLVSRIQFLIDGLNKLSGG